MNDNFPLIVREMMEFHRQFRNSTNKLSRYVNYSDSVKVVTITSMCRFEGYIDGNMIYIMYPLDIDIFSEYGVIPRNGGKMTVTGLPNGSTYSKRHGDKKCGLSTKVNRKWMHSVSVDMAMSDMKREKTFGYGNVNFKISHDNIHSCGINDESKILPIYMTVLDNVNRCIEEFNYLMEHGLDYKLLSYLAGSKKVKFESIEHKKKWIESIGCRKSILVDNCLKQSENSAEFYELLINDYNSLVSLSIKHHDQIVFCETSVEMMKNTFNISSILNKYNITPKSICDYVDTVPMLRYMVHYHADSGREPRIMIPQHDKLDDNGDPITVYDKLHTFTMLNSGIINHTAFGGESVEKVFNIFMTLIDGCISNRSRNKKIDHLISSIKYDSEESEESSDEIQLSDIDSY